MDQAEEEDPVAVNLLCQSEPAYYDCLNETREKFNKDTIILLLGLGLKGEEVELFQKHDIGLEKLSTLSYNDLEYIGITSSKKRQEIMSCIRKIHGDQKKFPSQEVNVAAEYCSEDAQGLDNILKHQQTLVKIIPYLKRNLNTRCGSIFFQPGISANHTFEKVTLCCVQQATQVHDQLCAFLRELEQQQNVNERQHKRLSKQRTWSQWWMKLGFVALIASSCVSLAVWGSRRGHNLPVCWLDLNERVNIFSD